MMAISLGILAGIHKRFGISSATLLRWAGYKPTGALTKRLLKTPIEEIPLEEVAKLLQGKHYRLSEWHIWECMLRKANVKSRDQARELIKGLYSKSEWEKRKYASFKIFINHRKQRLKELYKQAGYRKFKSKRHGGEGYKLSWDELFWIAKEGRQKYGKSIVWDTTIRKRLAKLGLTKDRAKELSYEEYKRLVAEYQIRKYLKDDWKELLYNTWYKLNYTEQDTLCFLRAYAITKQDMAGKSFEKFLDFVFERVYTFANLSIRRRTLLKDELLRKLCQVEFKERGGRYAVRKVSDINELIELYKRTSAYHVLDCMDRGLYENIRSFLKAKGIKSIKELRKDKEMFRQAIEEWLQRKSEVFLK